MAKTRRIRSDLLEVRCLPHKKYYRASEEEQSRPGLCWLPFFAFIIFQCFLSGNSPIRKIVAHGGRSSGKTIAIVIVSILVMEFVPNSLVLVLRELEKSLADTSFQHFEDWILKLGLQKRFRVYKTGHIEHKFNKSRALFKGIERNPEAMKSIPIKPDTLVFVEEAETISEDTLKVLMPTINRERNAICVFVLNPKEPTSAVYRRYLRPGAHRNKEGLWTPQINWYYNPYHNEGAEHQRREDYRENRAEYAHHWEGALLPEATSKRILSRYLIECARMAHKHPAFEAYWKTWDEIDAPVCMGVDPAYTSGYTGICIRKGPLIRVLTQRACGDIMEDAMEESAKWAREMAFLHNVEILIYDATAAGPMFRAFANKLDWPAGMDWVDQAFKSTPYGQDMEYIAGRTNQEHFFAVNIQMAFNLQLRMIQTAHIIQGLEPATPTSWLAYEPHVVDGDEWLDTADELNIPVETETPTNKIAIRKKGADDKEGSPNRFDAKSLAFQPDILHGISEDFKYLEALDYAL